MNHAIPWLAYWAAATAAYDGRQYVVVVSEADYMELVADLPPVERVMVQVSDRYGDMPILVGDYTGIARLADA